MYPPSLMAQWIAYITNIIWLLGIALLMGGPTICKVLNVAEPDLLKKAREHPFQTFIGLFILNSMGASQLSTGAFEVYVDDQLVFSKLAVGRMPSGPELLSGMKALGYIATQSAESSY